MNRFFIFSFVVLTPFFAHAQDTLSLLFAGDVMSHQLQINSARQDDGTYEYDTCFSFVKKYISEADIAIANLETTLAGPPYSGYPAFCSPDELAFALQRAGFDILLTANNHSCDKGKKGIERTLKVLDSLKVPHTGTFFTQEQRDTTYPLLFEKNNFRLALLNYTYGTNGIAIPSPNIVNLIDTAQIAADIIKARAWSPDIIIANMHWGNEYSLSPSAEQSMLARFLFERGVRLVIGSHPHVLQRMEKHESKESTLSSKVVVYSLGNFISNMLRVNTEIGVMTSIELIKTDDDILIGTCGYRLTWVYKPVHGKKTAFYILPVADYEENTDFFVKPEYLQRMKKSAAAMRTLFEKENVRFIEYK